MRSIETSLHLSEIPNHPVALGASDLFHTVGVVKVPERVRLGADAGNYDLGVHPDLDRLDFHERAVGTSFGSVSDRLQLQSPLVVRDEAGHEMTERFFEMNAVKLCTRRAVVPAMITLNLEIIRQNCLCYVMERYLP